MLLYTTTYVGITSLSNMFFFNIYNSKSYYHLNLSRKFHFTTINKMALFFLILRLIFTRAKKSLFHIWSYHLNYRSQWPWFWARHIVFMRYTYLPNLMILEQVVFSLRVGQDFSLFGRIILLEGHSDPISKRDTSSTRAVPADKVWWL